MNPLSKSRVPSPLSRREMLPLGFVAAADELQDGLARLVREHRMPGAGAGVSREGRIITAGAGIANLNTNAPMTAELALLTGSITKVWSATMIMTLVDSAPRTGPR